MNIIYWASTILVSVLLAWSAFAYFFHEATLIGVRDLGIPDYLRIQFAIFNIVAIILLLFPTIPIQIKEWGYAFAAFFLITAIVAHAAHNDPFYFSIINIFFIGLLIVSNIYLHKIHNL